LQRLCGRPKDFTWDECCTLMRQCGFELYTRPGSARFFVHGTTGQKVRLHEPHPQPTLKPYAVNDLIEALRDAGEIDESDTPI
jgi:predicted RNA binding protein YcfA (HicA-like mRNA interferase family)